MLLLYYEAAEPSYLGLEPGSTLAKSETPVQPYKAYKSAQLTLICQSWWEMRHRTVEQVRRVLDGPHHGQVVCRLMQGYTANRQFAGRIANS